MQAEFQVPNLILGLLPLCLGLVELSDELLEDEGVDVLGQLVEEEPVAQPGAPADELDLAARAQAGAGRHQNLAQAPGEHGDQPINDLC